MRGRSSDDETAARAPPPPEVATLRRCENFAGDGVARQRAAASTSFDEGAMRYLGEVRRVAPSAAACSCPGRPRRLQKPAQVGLPVPSPLPGGAPRAAPAAPDRTRRPHRRTRSPSRPPQRDFFSRRFCQTRWRRSRRSTTIRARRAVSARQRDQRRQLDNQIFSGAGRFPREQLFDRPCRRLSPGRRPTKGMSEPASAASPGCAYRSPDGCWRNSRGALRSVLT